MAKWNETFRLTDTPFAIAPNELESPREGADGILRCPVLLNVIQSRTLGPWPVSVMEIEEHSQLKEFLSRVEQEQPRDLLLLIPEIRPSEAAKLRKQGAAFADARGNCFLRRDGVMIDVRGRFPKAKDKTSSSSPGASRTFSPFTARRAQVSAMLLSYPALLNATIREIGIAARVSTGTAASAMKLLVDVGYLHKLSSRYYFAEAEPLLREWARVYPAGLGRQLLKFQGTTGVLEDIAMGETLAWLSGEAAAGDLIRGGNSANFYVPGETEMRQLIRAGRMRRNQGAAEGSADASQGKVSISKAFWAGHIWQQLEYELPSPSFRQRGPWASWDAAPLAIIYADLLSHEDPRVNEIAAEIKETMIKRWGTKG